jgi:hypothetical protein
MFLCGILDLYHTPIDLSCKMGSEHEHLIHIILL